MALQKSSLAHAVRCHRKRFGIKWPQSYGIHQRLEWYGEKGRRRRKAKGDKERPRRSQQRMPRPAPPRAHPVPLHRPRCRRLASGVLQSRWPPAQTDVVALSLTRRSDSCTTQTHCADGSAIRRDASIDAAAFHPPSSHVVSHCQTRRSERRGSGTASVAQRVASPLA